MGAPADIRAHAPRARQAALCCASKSLPLERCQRTLRGTPRTPRPAKTAASRPHPTPECYRDGMIRGLDFCPSRADRPQASVDANALARDPAVGGVEQENDRRGNITWLTQTSRSMHGDRSLLRSRAGQDLLRQGRTCKARSYAVDSQRPGITCRCRKRQGDDSTLGGSNGLVTSKSRTCGGRGHEHHRTAAAAQHATRGAHGRESRGQVLRQRGLEFLGAGQVCRLDQDRACKVGYAGKRSQLARSAIEQRVHGVEVTRV